mgnify:CR=1 FL=1
MPRNGRSGYPPSPGPRPGEAREVIFEFSPIGGSVKLTAVDVETGIEVSVIGPSTASQHELERIAVQKLKLRLGREGGGEAASGPDKPHDPPKDGGTGGGILV